MLIEKYSYEQFCTYFPVSRETHQKLGTYVSVMEKWQNSINLISSKTLPMIWNRHIIDSYQLVSMASSSIPVMDMGTGAGLPGIVLSIAGYKVSLVESDGKKVAFLREVAGILSLDITIHHQRVEDVTLPDTLTITARAFTPVANLFSLLSGKLKASHKLLLLKGKTFRDELAEAEKQNRFDLEVIPSVTDPSGAILSITHVQPLGA